MVGRRGFVDGGLGPLDVTRGFRLVVLWGLVVFVVCGLVGYVEVSWGWFRCVVGWGFYFVWCIVCSLYTLYV